MEVIRKNEQTLAAADVVNYMQDFCQAKGLDLANISHLQFKAVCVAVGKHFFNNDTAYIYINNNRNRGIDYTKLLSLYELYNSICMLYDKIPNVISYTYFVGLDTMYLYNCINGNDKDEAASLACGLLVQKLGLIREDSLKDRAIDKGGAVGVAIVGNSEFSWNDPTNKPLQVTNNNAVALPDFAAKTSLKAL